MRIGTNRTVGARAGDRACESACERVRSWDRTRSWDSTRAKEITRRMGEPAIFGTVREMTFIGAVETTPMGAAENVLMNELVD